MLQTLKSNQLSLHPWMPLVRPNGSALSKSPTRLKASSSTYRLAGVSIAAAALLNPTSGRYSSRRATICKATEDSPRKVRRRRKNIAEDVETDADVYGSLEQNLASADFSVKEAQQVVCDCDLILDTVLEMDNLLTDDECQTLINAASKKAAQIGWGQVKHSNYATEDVKVWALGSHVATKLFEEKITSPMRRAIGKYYRLPESRVVADDCFIVRYTLGSQTSLRFHRDGSIVSGIVSLSNSTDYEGGGTAFRNGAIYRPEQGSGILLGGQREHSGVEITKGTRFIATLFFTCGHLSCRDLAVEKDADAVGGVMGALASLLGFDKK